MRARMRGWPKAHAPFSLGAWRKPVNVLAILWGALMLVNFLWWTNSTESLRVISNPKASQTGGLVNYHIGFLNGIPVIELLIGVVVLVGAIYYLSVQRNKPFTPVVPPEDTDLPVEASA